MNESNISTGISILKLTNCSSMTSNCLDGSLFLISISSTIFGVINLGLSETLTGMGYIGAGAMAGVSLFTIKRMRLRAAISKSVNVLSQENDELKENNEVLQENNEVLQENNEELKGNVDELEKNVDTLESNIIKLKNIENNLKSDLDALKNMLGLIGSDSENAIKEIKEILNNLKNENDRHALLVKSQIVTHIYSIYDNSEISNDNEDSDYKISNFKDILLELYPTMSWNSIFGKIKMKELH